MFPLWIIWAASSPCSNTEIPALYRRSLAPPVFLLDKVPGSFYNIAVENNAGRRDDPVKKLISDTVHALNTVPVCSAMEISHACPPPDRREVVRVLKALQALLFPLCFRRENPRMSDEALLESTARDLTDQLSSALRFSEEEADPTDLCDRFLSRLPAIKRLLLLDVEALYEGDPAAVCREEVLICYPGFYAISIYRLAHELYLLHVPLLPRIMTEFAHEKTGIDIHPGATIGEYFFIDHGTGIVVGETTKIGNHVKVYQGVTLGALSTRGGRALNNVKRHPTIEDDVTIYSGASILGGETVIGKGSVVGGNTFITKSVPAGTRVSVKNQELVLVDGKKEVRELRDTEDTSWFYVI